jgi:tetratricopeptide (TPR) repeat protein
MSPNEADDRTQQVPRPEPEITQAIPPPTSSPAPADDRQLAAELSRRGIPPDEIQRILALSRGENAPEPAPKGKVVRPTPPILPPSEAFKAQPSISFPDFRDTSTSDRMDADKLLTAVNIARRRGNFKEAEARCREAIEIVPKDAAALELYGDVLQGVGRVDDAIAAYQRAVEADAKRKSAEKKFAELTLLQNREIEILRDEYIPRNPFVAVVFSGLCPGAGQIYNGDTVKGILMATAFICCLLVIEWSPLGLPGSRHGKEVHLTGSLVGFLAAAAITYAIALIDANMGARRGKRRSGWDV